MKYILEKDKKKRSNFFAHEHLRNSLKCMAHDTGAAVGSSPYLLRKSGLIIVNNFSRVTIKNRCVMTGRPRSVYRFSRLSRIKFREKISFGQIPGLKKSSW